MVSRVSQGRALWLGATVFLLLALGCHSRVVGVAGGERAAKRQVIQEMESEEVEVC